MVWNDRTLLREQTSSEGFMQNMGTYFCSQSSNFMRIATHFLVVNNRILVSNKPSRRETNREDSEGVPELLT